MKHLTCFRKLSDDMYHNKTVIIQTLSKGNSSENDKSNKRLLTAGKQKRDWSPNRANWAIQESNDVFRTEISFKVPSFNLLKHRVQRYKHSRSDSSRVDLGSKTSVSLIKPKRYLDLNLKEVQDMYLNIKQHPLQKYFLIFVNFLP